MAEQREMTREVRVRLAWYLIAVAAVIAVLAVFAQSSMLAIAASLLGLGVVLLVQARDEDGSD